MHGKVGFRKNISTFSLMMTGVTTVIGSGWLLSTQKIAEIAGPASLLSWVVGALIAMTVGMFFVEIGSIYRSSGGIGYYSHITHGRFCGFLTSWINWLSIVAVAPIEAQSIVQYLSQLNPRFAYFYSPISHELTTSGIVFALILMLFFMLVNYWSVKLFIRFNNLFTVIKVVIPLATIAVLVYSGLHMENFGHSLPEFMPNGFSAVLTSVVVCGVVMSFNGFQSPLNFSEEIAHPRRMLPIAVIGSIIVAFVVYILLQIVFIGGVDPAVVASRGWEHINFRSPYISLLLLANAHLMIVTVYVGAVISPAACGVAFIASSSRILHSLASEKHLPAFLGMLHPQYHSPRRAIITCTLVGCVFLFLFKGWYSLVAVISVLHVFSYLPAPIIVIANRLKHKKFLNQKEGAHFIMPLAHVLAPILLFILSILIFYASWPLVGEMAFLMLPGLAFYFYYEFKIYKGLKFTTALLDSLWFIFHLAAVDLITYLGHNSFHAVQTLSTSASIILLAALSVVTYVIGAYVSFDKTEYTHNPRILKHVEKELMYAE